MRFFPRKNSPVSSDSNSNSNSNSDSDSDKHAKEELKANSDALQAEVDKSQNELDGIQRRCEEGRIELQDIALKVQKVKEEYDTSIDTLMSVKKDLNQGRLELDAIHREHRNVSGRIKVYETSAEVDMHLAKARESLLRTRDETRNVMHQRDELRGQAEQQQAALSKIQDEIRQAEQQQAALSKIQDEIRQAEQQQAALSKIQDEIRQAEHQRDELRGQAEQQQAALSSAKDEMVHRAEHDSTDTLSKIQDEIRQAEQQRDRINGQAEQQQAALSKIQDEIRQTEKKRKEQQPKAQDMTKQTAEHGDANTLKTLSKIQDEIRQAEQQRDELRGQAERERRGLSGIRKEQMMAKERLDETNAMLYNAKDELDKKAKTQDTGILTAKERVFIQGSSANSGGSAKIIEAASAVVGSLKSKLKEAHDRIDSIQSLLEKEQEMHKKTMRKLESLKKSAAKSARPESGKEAA